MRRPGRFTVRLAVVLIACGAVVGLGYLWHASSLATLVTDGSRHGGDHAQRRDGFDRGGSSAFGLDNIDDLAATLLIGGSVLAATIMVDRVRRRYRPVYPQAGSRETRAESPPSRPSRRPPAGHADS